MTVPKYFLLFFLLCPTLAAWSWSAMGHRLIGQIAYDKLRPAAKRRFAHLNQSLNAHHRYYSLVSAAIWLDAYDQQVLAYKPMHYIDLPFSPDGTALPNIGTINAVSAICQASTTLNDAAAITEDQARALRIILHVVGDIHQPLHAVTRVTAGHPKGDRGGNDFHLGKNKIAPNLHRYWDRGGGLLMTQLSAIEGRQLAQSLEQQWRCPEENLDIMHWAEESHAIAVNQAYAINEYAIPSADYQQATVMRSQQQLVIAGCRLAALLNHLSKKGASKEAITCPKNRVASPPVTAR